MIAKFSHTAFVRVQRAALHVVVAMVLGLVAATVHAQEPTAKEARALSIAAQRALAMQEGGAAKAAPAADQGRELRDRSRKVSLKSSAAIVVDEERGEILVAKNADEVMPIASLTKLMTALVVVEAKQSMSELLEIGQDDVDREKNTYSRLKVGARLTRGDMLLLALMSSENRAAQALSRHFPGGRKAFLSAMNNRARQLGMNSTHFADAAGLSDHSVSTARDLHRLLVAAYAHPLIRDYSTREKDTVTLKRSRLQFVNSNHLVRYSNDWDIRLQKTGFTNEAGRCLVMEVRAEGRRLSMVFLDSAGKLTRYGDAARVRKVLAQESSRSKRGKSVQTAAVESS